MKNLAKIIFEILENNNSIEIITQKVKEIKIENFGEYYKKEHEKLKDKYPIIDFKLNKIENSKDFLNPKTELEKFFYAVLWKQGDLIKLQNIIDGINKKDVKKGFVFQQFGKFLSSDNEPIIDQHTLRSFAYYKNKTEYYSITEITIKHLDFITEYKNFIQKTLQKIEGDKNQILFEIDRILFIFGRYIKNSK